MIVSVFGPNGIVTATTTVDTFYELKEEKDISALSPIIIPGLPHTHTFWGKFVLVYKFMTPYSYDSSLIVKLHELEDKWKDVPSIVEFMPYLKKTIVDNKFQLLGIVSGYDIVDAALTPFVYQITGDNIRRVNMDDKGTLIYSCVYPEKTPVIWKLLQKTKVLNGDKWEVFNDIRLRCDLFSIEKSIDLCRFFLKTNYYTQNINMTLYNSPLEMDLIVMQPLKFEISKILI